MKTNKTYVSLVGAGPGDRGLITVAGLACIQSADYLICDRLIDQRLLVEAPAGCQVYDVGKQAYSHYMSQQEINELIVSCARQGGHVVRLKGGDPYVFGRGGEEALRLAQEKIPFEVIPGVTSAVAGLCYAGVPITHREVARSFHVVTAHTKSGGLDPSCYPSLAAMEGTLVFLMGLAQVETISAGLIGAGKSADTPALVVSNATTNRQQTVVGTLQTIAGQVQQAQLPSPAIICVGGAITLRETLNFFESRPLFGLRILLTGAREKATRLPAALEALGAQVSAIPLLRLEPIRGALDHALGQLDSYTHIVLTSAKTVEVFFSALREKNLDTRALHRARICTIGPSTANALTRYGVHADLKTDVSVAEGLLDSLLLELTPSSRVLLPQSDQARPVLRNGLSVVCSTDAPAVYRSIPLERLPFSAEDAPDAVLFTSALAAKTFCQLDGSDLLRTNGIPAFSLGPVTSAELAKFGIPAIESTASTMDALAQAVCTYFSGRESSVCSTDHADCAEAL